MEIKIDNIYNCDCMQGLEELYAQYGNSLIDCVITSPPYNTGRNSDNLANHEGRYDIYQEQRDNDEYSKWTLDLFEHYNSILKPNGIVLYNMSYGTENTTLMSLTVADIIRKTPFTLADIIVWEKNSALPNNVSTNKLTRICEFVYVFCRKTEFDTFMCNKKVTSQRESGQKMYENIFNKILAKNNDENCPYNKATYSTELVNKLMNIYCPQNIVVLDTFMGSGTTAVACAKSGRHYLGFELSQKQCDWANNRLHKITNQVSIFDTEIL